MRSVNNIRIRVKERVRAEVDTFWYLGGGFCREWENRCIVESQEYEVRKCAYVCAQECMN